MKVTVDFSKAPDAAEWAAVLAEDGWKVTELTATGLEAEKVIGNTSSYPDRQLLQWYFGIDESGESGATVYVDVPVFADSTFSRQQLLDTIQTYTSQVEGDCETDTLFEIPLLENLRG